MKARKRSTGGPGVRVPATFPSPVAAAEGDSNLSPLMGGKPIPPVSVNFENMTRRTVIRLCAEANVRPGFGTMKPDDLRIADEAFLTSTAGGIMPVTKVDDKVIGIGLPGPLTLRLKDLYWALHENPKYATPVAYD